MQEGFNRCVGGGTKPLYKTTIIIWSEFNPATYEIHDLARRAMNGACYCSKQEITWVEKPRLDCDWDDTEFFGVDEAAPQYPTLLRSNSWDRRKLLFIQAWSDWFYNNTGVFSHEMVRQLAYLWPAVVTGDQIRCDPESAIVELLKEHGVPEDNAIWGYLDVVAEEE